MTNDDTMDLGKKNEIRRIGEEELKLIMEGKKCPGKVEMFLECSRKFHLDSRKLHLDSGKMWKKGKR